jgi:hypothetical protein
MTKIVLPLNTNDRAFVEWFLTTYPGDTATLLAVQQSARKHGANDFALMRVAVSFCEERCKEMDVEAPSRVMIEDEVDKPFVDDEPFDDFGDGERDDV